MHNEKDDHAEDGQGDGVQVERAHRLRRRQVGLHPPQGGLGVAANAAQSLLLHLEHNLIIPGRGQHQPRLPPPIKRRRLRLQIHRLLQQRQVGQHVRLLHGREIHNDPPHLKQNPPVTHHVRHHIPNLLVQRIRFGRKHRRHPARWARHQRRQHVGHTQPRQPRRIRRNLGQRLRVHRQQRQLPGQLVTIARALIAIDTRPRLHAGQRQQRFQPLRLPHRVAYHQVRTR